MTSRYHGRKISASQQTPLIEKAICIVEFLSAIMHGTVIHLNGFVFFFSSYLQDHGLLRSRNFATMATCRDDFSFL